MNRVDDEEILTFIRWLTDSRGYPPTVRELAKVTGLSLSGIHHRLGQLELAGQVTRDRGIPRSLRIVVQ